MDHVIRRWRIPKDFNPVLALILGFDDSRFNPGSITFGEYGPKALIHQLFNTRIKPRISVNPLIICKSVFSNENLEITGYPVFDPQKSED
ncbi:hypothetical protein AVEN_79819-1 [Araneus ventricosus]|uniref:Uncharacterized protein n=1 Tax=Araneus ventricosus TaxID=182803 RepID=A0A4Y2WAT5_ARAVE|nr:hypothetical protein AVEN_79819-1 [Araneus ventricosus]